MTVKRLFSAPKPRSLPTPTGTQDIASTLASWQSQLNPGLKNAAPQPTPVNFKVTNSRGGLTLSWSPVSGADGYEVLKSQNGSFTDDLQVIPVVGGKFSSYFDSTGGNAQTARYRIRTTSGTPQNPQSQRGPESGVVSHTSIDSSDTVTKPTTRLDQYTSDKTRSNARFGNYGTASSTSSLGKTGGTFSGAGVAGGSGTSGGTPATSTSFTSISTGQNSTATMIVSAGAQIVPDTTTPGIIAATKLQTVPITTTAPTNTQSLQYNSTNADLEYMPTPATMTKVSRQWLDSYSATTGLFTQSQPAEADLSVTDITTNNVSITAHGFAPKAPNDATKYLDGTGAYSTVTTTGKIGTYNAIATAGNGVPSEQFQTLNTGLVANYNAGVAKTLVTPTVAEMYRISFFQAISTPATTSSTFPSLTLGYTDAGGVVRTLILVATSAVNTTAVITQGDTVIYTNGSTPVTITSAAYASTGATAMAYELAVTAEAL